jgi:hypothetical protein
MSEANSNIMIDFWQETLGPLGGKAPFSNYKDLLESIDATAVGDVP